MWTSLLGWGFYPSVNDLGSGPAPLFPEVLDVLATQWTSTTELMFSKEILFRVRLVVDAATTAEAKVLVTAIDGSGGGQLGNTLSLSAATDAVREFRFGHGQTLGGGPLMFSLQVRRVTGAGNVTVYHPHPLHYGAVVAVAGGWV